MFKSILSYMYSFRNWILKNEPAESPIDVHLNRPVILFLLCILFSFGYVFALYFNWIIDGAMYAEMGSNYFPKSHDPSWSERFFATDAGYIPLPPRLIALLGSILNLSASTIPYFYTGSALLAAALMVSVFCLRPFRSLIVSDSLRFMTVIAIIMVADFETRTFINFTYFAAFFVAIITALAFVEKKEEVPRWSWFIPILMLAKPAVLTTLPAIVITALVSKSRFRLIAIISVIVGCVQIYHLVINQPNVALISGENVLLMKLMAMFQYFFGFIGEFSLGPFLNNIPVHITIFSGLLIFSAAILLIVWFRKPAGVLVLIGLSLIIFQAMINTFALSATWNQELSQLQVFTLSRTNIVMFFGTVLMVSSSISLVVEKFTFSFLKNRYLDLAAILFITWFIASGWGILGPKISKQPRLPTTNISQWQRLSSSIDDHTSPLCVPIDPLGWYYSRDCHQLNAELNWLDPITFDSLIIKDSVDFLKIVVPQDINGTRLLGLGIVVRPFEKKSPNPTQINAIFTLKNGITLSVNGERKLKYSGGLIMVDIHPSISIQEIETVTLRFDNPVVIATYMDNSVQRPAIIWLGN